MKNYTVAQLAYLAGIIDGEGSIYIGNFSSNPKTGTKNYQTSMEVTNTDANLINWLMENFGGRRYMYTKAQLPKSSNLEVHRWIVAGNLLTELCHLLMPYLIIKKRQAEIMIKMRKTFSVNTSQKGKQGTQKLTPEILAERQSYFEQMQLLHCRNYKNKK